MQLIGNYTRKLLIYAKKYRRFQIVLVLIFFPGMLLMAARPFFIEYLIDDIITKNNFSLLVPFLVLFISIIVLERISSYLTNRYHAKVNNMVTKNEQISLYKHIQGLKISVLSKRTTGDILARVLSDTEDLSSVVLIVPTIIANVINLVLIASVLTYLSWRLAIVTFITLPLYYFSLRFLATKLQSTAYLLTLSHFNI